MPPDLIALDVILYNFLDPISHFLVFVLDRRCVIEKQVIVYRVELGDRLLVALNKVAPLLLLQSVDAQEMRINLIQVPPLIAHLFLHSWHIHLHYGDIVLLHNGRHRGLISDSFDEIPF